LKLGTSHSEYVSECSELAHCTPFPCISPQLRSKELIVRYEFLTAMTVEMQSLGMRLHLSSATFLSHWPHASSGQMYRQRR